MIRVEQKPEDPEPDDQEEHDPSHRVRDDLKHHAELGTAGNEYGKQGHHDEPLFACLQDTDPGHRRDIASEPEDRRNDGITVQPDTVEDGIRQDREARR